MEVLTLNKKINPTAANVSEYQYAAASIRHSGEMNVGWQEKCRANFWMLASPTSKYACHLTPKSNKS